MNGQLAIAMILAVPVILFPAAFIWYLNVGGIYTAVRAARAKRAIQRAAGEPEL